MVVPKCKNGIVTLLVALVFTLCLYPNSAFGQAGYSITNLVSDQPGKAQHQDTQLKNAWGVAYAPGGYIWVSDNDTGVSTLYGPTGIKQSLVVTIPSSSGVGTGSPTGQVYNGTSDFVVSQSGRSGPATFIFATFDGTISGWNGSVNGTNAVIAVNHTGAWYTGITLGVNGGANFLYAADNLNNRVDVYDGSFNKVKSFTDTNLPPGSAPYNIANIKGKLFVLFTNSQGGGVVDIFDTAGNFIKTFASGGTLKSPWGIALAPNNFGPASNALLIANLGDGRINAFNPTTGKFLGESGVVANGLWALIFGGGSPFNGNTNQLFFTAGPNGYVDGLFGVINFK